MIEVKTVDTYFPIPIKIMIEYSSTPQTFENPGKSLLSFKVQQRL